MTVRRQVAGRTFAVSPRVLWRCDHHNQINHPDYPGCGCASPEARQLARNAAILASVLDLPRVERQAPKPVARPSKIRQKPGRKRLWDYDLLALAPGTCLEVAALFGCSRDIVSRARRLSR